MRETVTTPAPAPPTQRTAEDEAAAPAAVPCVDTAVLTRLLDGPRAGVRREVRALLATGRLTAPLGMDTSTHRAWALERMGDLRSAPGPHSGFPSPLGGSPDPGVGVTAFETLGHADLSLVIKSGVQWGLFGGAILHLGTERHQRYLSAVASLDLLGAFAMTESAHGSDVHSLRTTATYDPASEEFVVVTPDDSARKEYIGNAAQHGRLAAVFAKLVSGGEDHGVHAFLVPLRDEEGRVLPGVRIEDCGPKAGLNGVDNGRIWFDSVRIPRAALLDRYGSVAPDGTYSSPIEDPSRRFFTMLGTLVQGRVSVAGAALSAAKGGLTIAVRYADARRQFGSPGTDEETLLLDYRSHQRRLLPLLAQTYALHFAQAEVLEEFVRAFTDPDAVPDRRRLEARVAGHKALSTWHTSRTLQECREACGGAGYLAENLLPQLRADTDVFTTFEGDNTVLSQLVAKALLTEYRDQFGALDTLGAVRFVVSRLAGTVLDRTAARSTIERIRRSGAGDEESGIRSSSWHLSLLDFREERLVDSAARRIRAGTKAGRSSFEVFNECQDHLLTAARAHTERLTHEAFVAAVEACEDPGTKLVLERLCDLHALSLIEADRGWFLEHDRLSPGRSRALAGAVNELCAELRGHAVDLVDAFAVPAAALPAAILDPGSPSTPGA